ncbi:MAG TPA: hypothetical protein VK251_07070 [Steroidobacteraceae bacterium]|nr:hypothetical protein [Steroidobacteraceae bacterium]
MLVFFWACCNLLLYVYLLYPLSVRLLAVRVGRRGIRASALPTVTIVVTAYNEERCVRTKLDNLLALHYPPESRRRVLPVDGIRDAAVGAVRRGDCLSVTRFAL